MCSVVRYRRANRQKSSIDPTCEVNNLKVAHSGAPPTYPQKVATKIKKLIQKNDAIVKLYLE
jgi:hypothetical protein